MLPLADVAIVGAGASGLTVADALLARGLRCLVLEAGPLDLALPDRADALERLAGRHDPGNRPTDRYRVEGLPAEWQRVRAAGGRTLLWGGWCHRFSPQALHDAALRGTPWPLDLAELRPHYQRVERRLHVRRGTLPDVQRQAARELGLRIEPKRTALYGARPRVTTDWPRVRPAIAPGLTAVRVLLDDRGRAEGVQVLDRRGQLQDVRARAVVLCASTVETLRLLLAPAVRQRLACPERLGRDLVDHLVLSWLVLGRGPAPRLHGLQRSGFVPRFVNLDPTPDRDYAGGFCLEVTGPFPAAELGPERLRLLDLTAEDAAGLHAFAVHALGDAAPHPDRRVTLHDSERDALGRPVPVLHLAWGGADHAMARDMAEAGLALCDALVPAAGRIVPLAEPLATGGPVHETGGCRIGLEGTPADAWGAVRGVPGLWVADASAMPSAGDAHPTLTLLALATRTAARLAAQL